MKKVFANLSLRARLWLVALLAAGALVVVAFVAWRLARATETFVARQSEWTLREATGALVAELGTHPHGRTEAADSNSVEQPAPPRARPPIPPHEREILSRYSDPFVRSGAIALHRFPEATGGFLCEDGRITGVVSQSPDASVIAHLTDEEEALMRRLAAEVRRTGEAKRGEIETTNGRALLEVAPTMIDPENLVHDSDDRPTGAHIVAAWTRVQLPKRVGASDWLNVVALILLSASVSLVIIFTWTTLRTLDGDVTKMRQGLHTLSGNLDAEMPSPRTPELRPVVASIGAMATELRRSVERHQVLQREMARNERLTALGRVVAGVAHEVRNPLAAMRLKIQTTRRAGLPHEKLERTFDVVIEEIDRLDSLVRRLLELGRPLALHVASFDLCELAHERAALIAEVAALQSVEVSVCVNPVSLQYSTDLATTGNAGAVSESGKACLVAADRERLAQVFDNLFRNALEAMPDGGALSVSCTRVTGKKPASAIRCTVSDTGTGVAPDERERIFEPFFSRNRTGTGLGLAIAREIVEAQGGTLDLADSDNGASFYFDLPQNEKATSP